MTDVYIFATNTQNTLVSYPHDQTHEFFQYAISKSKNNAQIVLVRKDNLLHYCYVRRIGNKKVFGLCLRIDRIYSDVKDLFRAFDSAFSKLVEAGIILQMDDKSNIKLNVLNFSSETVAIKEMSDILIHSLGNIQKSTLPLPPADYSISINDCIELSLEVSTNVQIINATKKYSNVYIVKTHAEIARITEIANLIKKKNGEIQQLRDTIIQQDTAISDLKKQKNKYKWVLLLLSIIFIGAIVFFNVMQSKNDSLFKLNQENASLKKHVNSLQNDSTTLSQILLNTQKDLSNAINRINTDSLIIDSISTENRAQVTQINNLLETSANYRDDISTLRQQLSFLPIKIDICNQNNDGSIDIPYGEKIDANKSMFLASRFECYSNTSQEISFILKLYYPSNILIGNNENKAKGYTEKKQFTLRKGKNICEYGGWGGGNRGYYTSGNYRCEIWINDIKVGERYFTLY